MASKIQLSNGHNSSIFLANRTEFFYGDYFNISIGNENHDFDALKKIILFLAGKLAWSGA